MSNLKARITGITAHDFHKRVTVQWYAINPETKAEATVLLDSITVEPLADDKAILDAIKSRRSVVERERPVVWPDTAMNAELLNKEI